MPKRVRWYRLAAEQDHAYGAQSNLGVMYDKGRGVPQGRGRSLCAGTGWPPSRITPGSAQFNLGVMYDNGRGVLKDEAEAAALVPQGRRPG